MDGREGRIVEVYAKFKRVPIFKIRIRTLLVFLSKIIFEQNKIRYIFSLVTANVKSQNAVLSLLLNMHMLEYSV